MVKPLPEKLTKAKSRLVLRQAFFATLLLGLELVEDDMMTPPTMAVDGAHIYFHPDFVKSCSVEQLVGVLAHETLHLAMLHPWRRGTRQAKKANYAMDYAINGIIEDAGLELPPTRLRQASFDGKSFEEIYHLLPDQPEEQGEGSGQPGPGDFDNCRDAQGTVAEQQQAEAQAKVQIQQAANAAKAQGQLPASLAKLVAEIMEPKVDWKNELRRYMTLLTKSDQSWAKKQKRFQDIYLPAFHSVAMGKVVVGIDTSGSVFDDAPAFLDEVRSICEECKPEEVIVIQCDARVHAVDSYEAGEPIKTQVHGGGGTDLRKAMQYVREHDIIPSVMIWLSDGETPYDDEGPEFPVIWCLNTKVDPPWGDVIRI